MAKESTPTAAPAQNGSGCSPQLSLRVEAQPAEINLSEMGTIDWLIPIRAGFHAPKQMARKGTGTAVRDWSVSPNSEADAGSRSKFLWSDGSPDREGETDASGLWSGHEETLVSFTVLATTTPSVLRVYGSVFWGKAKLTAVLSDASVYPFSLSCECIIDVTKDGVQPGPLLPDEKKVFVVTFSAPNPGTILKVSWEFLENAADGTLTFDAVALSSVG